MTPDQRPEALQSALAWHACALTGGSTAPEMWRRVGLLDPYGALGKPLLNGGRRLGIAKVVAQESDVAVLDGEEKLQCRASHVGSPFQPEGFVGVPVGENAVVGSVCHGGYYPNPNSNGATVSENSHP